ncbi:MAG: glycosyltransferase [Candidatus Peribacteraceae bacterium]|nr:glycosyltransferase [Candidatus Peribacteraceae bacterium]
MRSRPPRPATSVSVIIPAFDEEATVGSVVRTARNHPLVGEVIVIDDGSTDRTAHRARKAGGRVLSFPENRGKGEAMEAGVRATAGGVIVFLDADMLDLSDDMLTAIIRPVMSGTHDMFTLLRDRLIGSLQHLSPSFVISGNRAMKREFWERIPRKDRSGFDVEIALNYYAFRQKRSTGTFAVEGLHHVIKEQKHGVLRGFVERLYMVIVCIRAFHKFYVFGIFRKQAAA